MTLKIKEKIDKVFDTSTANSWLVHLNEEQANKFIDYIVDESVIMKDAQVVRMSKPTKKVAEINIDDEIFAPWVRWTEVANLIKANALTKELVSKEIVALVRIYDDELDDNIEWNAFKDHLMRMIAKKGATQLEKVGMYAKKVDNPLTVDRMFNGFITQLKEGGGAVVDATDTGLFADRYIDRTKMSKLYKSVDSKYRNLIDKLYVPSDLMLDYEDKYLEWNTRVPTNRLWKLTFTEANVLGVPRAVELTGGFAETLTVDAVAGENTCTVSDGAVVTIGDNIAFALDKGQEYITTVTGIATNVLTLADAFPYNIDSANNQINGAVEVLIDAIDVLSMAKNNMLYGIQKDITIEPSRVAKLRATEYVLTARIDVLLLNPDLCSLLEWVKAK